MSDQATSTGDKQAATVTTASRPIRTATGTGAQGNYHQTVTTSKRSRPTASSPAESTPET
ncbi:hypothetical protein [Nonomuraea sp. NPDC049607]|uniref:hypothetical protein n=1 Tax=unclassified Nonomuraea TaxID=2593643 RepID=UPI00341A0F2F